MALFGAADFMNYLFANRVRAKEQAFELAGKKKTIMIYCIAAM